MSPTSKRRADTEYPGTPDMVYNGILLTWRAKQFNATSGNFYVHESRDPRTGEIAREVWDYRYAANQDVPNYGPIPEGVFWLSLKFAGEAKRSRDGQLLRGDGIERISGGEDSAWGGNRVRLIAHHIESKSARQNRDVNSFYIHDSHKGYTHGCLEVQNNFFAELRTFAAAESKKDDGRRRLWLRVDYASKFTSTLGKTKR
jgi:hypothetical protein